MVDSCLVILAVAGILTGVGTRFSGAAKAFTLGSAAGLAFGLQAAVTKTFVAGSGMECSPCWRVGRCTC